MQGLFADLDQCGHAELQLSRYCIWVNDDLCQLQQERLQHIQV